MQQQVSPAVVVVVLIVVVLVLIAAWHFIYNKQKTPEGGATNAPGNVPGPGMPGAGDEAAPPTDEGTVEEGPAPGEPETEGGAVEGGEEAPVPEEGEGAGEMTPPAGEEGGTEEDT